jgi:hypothetical protein
MWILKWFLGLRDRLNPHQGSKFSNNGPEEIYNLRRMFPGFPVTGGFQISLE